MDERDIGDTPNGADALVIGGGLAGSEAAWQLAGRGIRVRLVEMRPVVSGPAHHTDRLAELVCSNSLKSDDPNTAAGALKREMEALGSFVLAAARRHAVDAGGALAVDREAFSLAITRALASHPLVEIVRAEATSIPTGVPVILAAGPLPSAGFETALTRLVGAERLAFYDAAAPVIDAASIDRDVVFPASRYGKGGGDDYLNCPMSRDEYERFVDALLTAERVVHKEFESAELFQACQPVEEIARKGRDAPRFGALKPVGLVDPRTGDRPWAVVQLRSENAARTAYNLVGFQTNLAFAEQRRVFRMIPGLENAEFLRYGVMHRNTFVDSPRLLGSDLALREHPSVRVAGQLSGTEGYLEAAATGLLAALNVHAGITGAPAFILPAETYIGALVAYATDADTSPYQPMHVNAVLLPPLDRKLPKQQRYAEYSRRAHDALERFLTARSFESLRPSQEWP